MMLSTAHHHFVLLRCFTIITAALLFGGLAINTQIVQAQDQPTLNDDILFLSQREGPWTAYIMNPDGSDQRPITNQLNFPRSYISTYAAVFSPDRTQIVLAIIKTTDGTGEHRLYRVMADGTQLKLLWNGAADYLNPSWSPEGDRIVFSASSDGGQHVYVINSDGSGLKQLSAGASQFNYQPVWSLSGEQVLFSGDMSGDYNLFVVNADGTEIHPLLETPGYAGIWSPTDPKIVFVSRINGSLYIVNSDGSGVKRLTQMTQVYSPTWSPDGTKIAFLASVDNRENVYLINPDGSELTQLTDTGVHSLRCLEWLPSGEQLVALVSPLGRMLYDSETDVYTIQADGSGVMTRLTREDGTEALSNCVSLFG